AARVAAAREIQRRRFAGESIFSNAEMGNKQVERFCKLDAECNELLVALMEKMGLSMRAYFRIIKVARTIADLEGGGPIKAAHISEAACYRFLDRTPGSRF
ncbi:MAG: magnesium chelatase, partial [Bacteroidales bacterium]|nr:magnesium chelatase [Bacteroidales bacterium]